MMSTASWLATSPAAAPPMPSQTPNTVAALADELLAVGLHQAARAAGEVGDDEVVLVVLADLADVGAPEQTNANLCAWRRTEVRHRFALPTSSRNRCCPILRWSPWREFLLAADGER